MKIEAKARLQAAPKVPALVTTLMGEPPISVVLVNSNVRYLYSAETIRDAVTKWVKEDGLKLKSKTKLSFGTQSVYMDPKNPKVGIYVSIGRDKLDTNLMLLNTATFKDYK